VHSTHLKFDSIQSTLVSQSKVIRILYRLINGVAGFNPMLYKHVAFVVYTSNMLLNMFSLKEFSIESYCNLQKI
jgi:hypothetical protein